MVSSHDPPPRWPPAACSEIQVWLNARADGECTPAQEGVLADHLRGCAACAREWAVLERTRLAFEAARLREASDFEREALRRALAPRALNSAGWLLVGGGALVVAAFAVWETMSDTSLAWPLRFGAPAVAAGLLLLLGRAAWERRRVARHDPYREVRR